MAQDEMFYRRLIHDHRHCPRSQNQSSIGIALLAQADAQGLTYAGSAFIALSGTERAELATRIQMSKLERCPIPKLRFPDAQWVKPRLMARVRHLSGTNYIRHGTVRAFV